MEKAFSLDQKEAQAYGEMESEQTKTLAQIGMLSLDMEAAKKRLETVQEQQRSFVRSALMHRDVRNFMQARVGGGNIYCVLPDTPPTKPAPTPKPTPKPTPTKVNGQISAELQSLLPEAAPEPPAE
jgi:hypothetical protein